MDRNRAGCARRTGERRDSPQTCPGTEYQLIHLDLARSILELVLGAVLGVAGGLFGIGGGLLAIPILGLFFHLDQQHAQGTAMVMVAPNVFVGLIHYAKRGMDRRLAATLALCAIPCTYAGAHFATHVAGAPLRRWFALFLLALALSVALRALSGTGALGARAPGLAWPWASVVGAVGGTISGIFGVGGAVVAVPVTAVLFGLSQAAAQGLGLAMVAPGTLVGLVAYVRAGDVDWWLGIPLALGGVFVVKAGVALAHRLPERTLRTLFGVLLVTSAVALWTKT